MKRLLLALAIAAGALGCTVKLQSTEPALDLPRDAGELHIYPRFATGMNAQSQIEVFDEDLGGTDGTDVTYDTTTGTNRSSALGPARWGIYCTTDCWVRRGTTATTNTTKDSAHASFVPAQTFMFFQVTAGDAAALDKIQVIGDSAAGTMRLSRYSRLTGRF